MAFEWKIGNTEMKRPSTYKIDMEDLDNDSYRSKVTGALIDSVIAKKMHKIGLKYDYITETEAEAIVEAIMPNPITVTVKSPLLSGGSLTAPFRVSKISMEMFRNDSNAEWCELSFNLVQKRKVRGQ